MSLYSIPGSLCDIHPLIPQLPLFIQSHLKPELPEDVAVHFHISSAMLVLTVLSVTARSQASKDAGGGRSGDSNSWLGSTL